MIKNRVTFYFDVSHTSMMTITPSKSFAIYQTQKGIELLSNQAKLTDGKLICFVSHYQSAVRIARKAAQLHQAPFVNSDAWYIVSANY